jgi:hypothetical protein
MRLSIKSLRSLIREEIGRNFHSIETNPPFNFENQPGIEVSIYPAESGQTYYVEIIVMDNDNLSSPTRSFQNEEEARMFARQYVDEISRKRMASNL